MIRRRPEERIRPAAVAAALTLLLGAAVSLWAVWHRLGGAPEEAASAPPGEEGLLAPEVEVPFDRLVKADSGAGYRIVLVLSSEEAAEGPVARLEACERFLRDHFVRLYPEVAGAPLRFEVELPAPPGTGTVEMLRARRAAGLLKDLPLALLYPARAGREVRIDLPAKGGQDPRDEEPAIR